MTQAEKLEALVRKAIESKFNWHRYMPTLPKDVEIEWWVEGEENPDDAFVTLIDKDQGQYSWRVEISREQMLFNKDFARALFGEQEFTGLDAIIGPKDMFTGVERTHYWQYYLQQAVTSDDPIDYMYKAVFDQ